MSAVTTRTIVRKFMPEDAERLLIAVRNMRNIEGIPVRLPLNMVFTEWMLSDPLLRQFADAELVASNSIGLLNGQQVTP
jgi:hypothetical protein